jgi:hypothetical protein
MNSDIYNKRKLNGLMTRRLIELHGKGFDADFILLGNNYLMCLQNSDTFPHQSYSMLLVDQVYDYLSASYKYIYAIEAFTGEKGVLLADGIVQSSFLAN